jgi:hypothetical protein
MPDRAATWPVLVTATVQPDSRALAQLKDPILRKNEYIKSLKWLATQNAHIGHVVFCENSGYDLREFEDLGSVFAKRGLSLEVRAVQPPDKSVFLGKGWGESLMIRWALENIESLKPYDSFIKITGRYKILNMPKILKTVRTALAIHPDLKFICQNFHKAPRLHADTVLFWSNRRFYMDHLLDTYTQVDDYRGFYIEHAIAERLLRISGHLKIGVLPVPLIMKGLKGSDSLPVSTLRDIVRESIKQVVFPTPPLRLLKPSIAGNRESGAFA